MATLTPQFFQLLEAEEKDVFFKNFSQIELLFPQLFARKGSTKAYEDRLRVAGLGTFATKPEGTPVAFDDPAQGNQIRTVHQTYALGWRATMEMMQDDQFGIMDRMSADLGDSARDHQERLAWGLLNDGFSGSTYTGLDGLALFSASHTRLKTTGTASNLLSPAVALSVTGIESMMNQASTTESEEGRYINMNQAVLAVHPNEQHNTYVLLNTEFKPGSADNDRSTVVASRSGLRPLEVPYKSSTTSWSIHAAPGQNDLCWWDRMGLDFKQADDADTYDKKHYGLYRASVGFSEWRGNWGSNA